MDSRYAIATNSRGQAPHAAHAHAKLSAGLALVVLRPHAGFDEGADFLRPLLAETNLAKPGV